MTHRQYETLLAQKRRNRATPLGDAEVLRKILHRATVASRMFDECVAALAEAARPHWRGMYEVEGVQGSVVRVRASTTACHYEFLQRQATLLGELRKRVPAVQSLEILSPEGR